MYIRNDKSRVCFVRIVLIAWGRNAVVVHNAAKSPIAVIIVNPYPYSSALAKLRYYLFTIFAKLPFIRQRTVILLYSCNAQSERWAGDIPCPIVVFVNKAGYDP